MNAFRQLLQATEPKAGTWIMSASPLVAEAIGHAGFDWGLIDMEHTPLDMMEVIHLLQAVAGTPMVPVVRVPWNDTVTVKRVLDAGAPTLMFPFVQNADEARRLSGEDDVAAAARALRARTQAPVLITLGADGALLDGETLPAPPVDVVDTTGAGDTVNGALAACLAAGEPLHDAARFALAAASLSTRSPGARAGMPRRENVLAAL